MFKNEEMNFILVAIIFIAIIFFYYNQQNCEGFFINLRRRQQPPPPPLKYTEFNITGYTQYSDKNALNGDIQYLNKNEGETTSVFIQRCADTTTKMSPKLGAIGFIVDADENQNSTRCWIKRCDGCASAIKSLTTTRGYIAFFKK